MMELFGNHARVLIEVETEAGDRLQFPIEGTEFIGGGLHHWHELRIPFSSGWLARVLETLDEYTFRTGRD